MLSKRLKSHSKANISRGLGKRIDVRAPLAFGTLPEELLTGRISLEEIGSGRAPANEEPVDGGRPKRRFSRTLAWVSLALALFILPLSAWAGWKLYAEYAEEQARAAEEAALFNGYLPAAGHSAAAAEAGLPQLPPGLLNWLKEQSDIVMRGLGHALYSQDSSTSSVDYGSSAPPPGETAGERISTDAANAPSPVRQQDSALAGALRNMFPSLDSRAYYMLWNGTTVLCAPLAPEAEGLDLSALRGAAGEEFVLDFARKAEERGGYLLFSIAPGEAGDRYSARIAGKLDRTAVSGVSGSVQGAGKDDSGGANGNAPRAGSHPVPGPAVGSGGMPGPAGGNINILAYIAPFEDTGTYLTVWRSLPSE